MTMKLRDLRTCDNCDGPIRQIFHVVRHSHAIVKTQAVREFVGLSTMLGSPALAEVMGAHQDDAVALLAEVKDENGKPNGWGEIFLCTDCWCGDVNLAAIAERLADEEEVKS